MKPPDSLVWVDIETTGLDPDRDLILEIAVLITDSKLREIIHEVWVIKPEHGLPAMDQFIVDTHSRNGLFDDLHRGIQIANADASLAALIARHSAKGGPIAGSSPHFDKSFIRLRMPKLAACFNHRCYDVSTLKQAWCAEHGQEWKASADDAAHRALADIRESVAAARQLSIVRTSSKDAS